LEVWTKTNKEIEQYRRELVQIQIQCDVDQKWKQAKELAMKVGASIWRIHPLKDSDIEAPPSGEKRREAMEATVAEIVHNIHYALQTATMINMCKTANRNFWIAIVASLVAILSMLAAWTALLTQLNCFK
jgi:hypothetical protein